MFRSAITLLLVAALSCDVFGHGFDVSVQSTPQGLQLVAVNNGDPTDYDRLFGEYWFDSAPDDYKAIHGGIIKTGGFNGTVSLNIEFLSKLWFSDGHPAVVVSQNESIFGASFDGFNTLGSVTIDATTASPGSFPVTGLSDHSLGWTLQPYPVNAGSYGFSYRVTGFQQNASGTQVFLPSQPVVVALSTPGFFGSGGFSVEDSRNELYKALTSGNSPTLSPNQWKGPGGGAYHTAANWVDSPAAGVVPNGVDAVARFLGTITADSTVTLDAPATVGVLQFDNAHRYTLAGPAALTLSNATTAEIKLISGDHTIAAPLAIASNTNIVAGAQTLTLSGTPSWSANKSLIVASGTLQYNTSSAAASVGAGAKLAVAPGSSVNVGGTANPFAAGASRVSIQNDSTSGLNINAGSKDVGAISGLGKTTIATDAQLTADSIRQSTLAVHGSAGHASGRLTVRTGAGPASVSVLGSLQLDATPAPPDNNPATPENIYYAGLDLTRNKLIVDYSGVTTLSAIRDALQAGYGASQNWSSQVGITTSLGDASAMSLGYAEASVLFDSFPAQFAGEQIDDTAILIAYTRYGDTNLSGTVDFTDLNNLLTNYGLPGGWSQGDFDYNGTVNFTDLNMLLTNYGQAVAALAPAGAVPEPGSLLLALVAAVVIGGSCRRCRRNQTKH